MTRHSQIDEKDLLIRLQQGDEKAFSQLMKTYKQPLGRVMVRILKSREHAEDTLQDLFAGIWQHRFRIDTELPFRSYLFGIARNLVNEALRASAREDTMLQHYHDIQEEYYTHVEESVLKAENRQLLDQAMGQLTERQRQVYILCKLEGKTYRETGRILSISSATVNIHMSGANASIRQFLRDHTDLCAALIACSIALNV